MNRRTYADYRADVDKSGETRSPEATARLDEIFNTLIPSLREKGIMVDGELKRLPSAPLGPPTYDRNAPGSVDVTADRSWINPYEKFLNFDSPWRDFRKEWTTPPPPPVNVVSPKTGETMSITPPEPVDWGDRAGRFFTGLGNLGKTTANVLAEAATGSGTISDWVPFQGYAEEAEQRAKEAYNPELDPSSDSYKPEYLWEDSDRDALKSFGKFITPTKDRLLNTLSQFGGYTEPDLMRVFGVWDEAVMQPIGGNVTTSEGFLARYGMRNPLFDEEAAAIAKQLQAQGYGRQESAQAAYNQAGISGLTRFIIELGLDPLNYVGIGLAGKAAKAPRLFPKGLPAGTTQLPTGSIDATIENLSRRLPEGGTTKIEVDGVVRDVPQGPPTPDEILSGYQARSNVPGLSTPPPPTPDEILAGYQSRMGGAAGRQVPEPPQILDENIAYMNTEEFRRVADRDWSRFNTGNMTDTGQDISISPKALKYKDRNIIMVRMPDGEMQPFYRRTGDGGSVTGDGARAGQYAPFDALLLSGGKGADDLPNTWFVKDRFAKINGERLSNDHPLYRYGNEQLKAVGRHLDSLKLRGRSTIPEGEITNDYQEINSFLTGLDSEITPMQMGLRQSPGRQLQLGEEIGPIVPDVPAQALNRTQRIQSIIGKSFEDITASDLDWWNSEGLPLASAPALRRFSNAEIGYQAIKGTERTLRTTRLPRRLEEQIRATAGKYTPEGGVKKEFQESFNESVNAINNLIDLRRQGKHTTRGFSSYYGKLRNLLARRLDLTAQEIDDYLDQASQGILDTNIAEPLRDRNALQSRLIDDESLFPVNKPLNDVEINAMEESKYPAPDEFSREARDEHIARTDSTGKKQAEEVVHDVAVKEAVQASSKKTGNRFENYDNSQTAFEKSVSDMFPWIPEKMVRWMNRVFDSSNRERILTDYILSRKEAAEIDGYLFSDLDILSQTNLAPGSILPKAVKRIQNFKDSRIDPLIGKKAGDNVGVEYHHISRYVQAMHWRNFVVKPDGTPNMAARELPVPYDPSTGKAIKDSVTTNADGTYREMEEWITSMRDEMTDSEFARVEQGAKELAEFYNVERERLVKTGHISRELADELKKDYPYYNPTIYAEYMTKKKAGSGRGNSAFAAIERNVIQGLKEDAPTLGALDPLDPEVMLRTVASNEYRIQKNTANKAMHHMLNVQLVGETQKPLNWLKEVTNEFATKKKDGTVIRHEIPFDRKKKQGYLVFWENGERRVFGGVDGKYIDEDIFEMIHGKGGMATRSTKDLEGWLAAAAGMKRASLTTFSPVFMIANGFIDMYTVWVRYGIAPPSILKRMKRELTDPNGIMREGEDRLYEAFQVIGADKSRTSNIYKEAKDLQQRINDAGGHGDEVFWADDFGTSDKARLWLNEKVETNFIARGAKALEQSPRLEVFERTIRSELGSKEWLRLKQLPEAQWKDELLNNYQGTPGRGLADHPAMRKAGTASLDATLDFWRGGAWVRNINPYTYFINAAAEGAKLPFRTLGINLHPNVRPVMNPVAGGPRWEFGTFKDALPMPRRRGATGKIFEDIDIRNEFPDLPRGQNPEDLMAQLNYENSIFRSLDDVMPNMKHRGMAKMSLMRLGGVMTAQTGIMAWNLAHADEWGYWDIPGWVKYTGLLILMPPRKDENGNVEIDASTGKVVPNYVVIPHRTREWTLFAGVPVYAMEKTYEMMQEPDPETGERLEKTDISKFFGQVMDNWNPLPDTNLVSSIPFLSEAIEETTGKDFWRDEPIVSEELQHLDPELQFDQRTSPTAKFISENIIPEGWVYDSPQRMDHLSNNLFGSSGQSIMGFTDYVGKGIDELRRTLGFKETLDKSPEAQVEHYRGLKTSSERTAYRATIARQGIDALEKFETELRKPRTEWSQLPVINQLVRRYNPPYGGGVRELTESLREDEFPEVDASKRAEVQTTFRRLRKQQMVEQQEDDAGLDTWSKKPMGTTGGMTSQDWKNRRSERLGKFSFAREIIPEIYAPNSIYTFPAEEQQKYFNMVHQVIGQASAENIQLTLDMLMTSYFSIKYPDANPQTGRVDPEEEDKFYEARDNFIDSTRSYHGEEVFNRFSDLRRANMTDMEVSYDRARTVMNPYWEIGRTADSFIPDYPPQQKQLWDTYVSGMKADGTPMSDREKYDMGQHSLIQGLKRVRDSVRERYVRSTVDPSTGQSLLDNLLVYWYGDVNPDRGYKPVTPDGIGYGARLWGTPMPNLLPPQLPANPYQNPVGPDMGISTPGGFNPNQLDMNSFRGFQPTPSAVR